MKYIQKCDAPDFFIQETKNLSNWNEFQGEQKRILKDFILKNEQNYLCCYCEGKVNISNSHLEHIKPKFLDIYNLTFDYKNISVSCNGLCNSSEKEYCGHKKSNFFNENEFLNPTLLNNIRDYFKYDADGKIKPSSIDESKSSYTINLLQLNTHNGYLQEARKKALKEFRKFVSKKANNKDEIKSISKILLSKENLAYISFLKFYYE